MENNNLKDNLINEQPEKKRGFFSYFGVFILSVLMAVLTVVVINL